MMIAINKIIVLVLTVSLTVSSIIIVSQSANGIVIRAFFDARDIQPSSTNKTSIYNLRNVNVSDISFPTILNDSEGGIPSARVSVNSMSIDGVLTSKTSAVDSNKSRISTQFDVTNVRNDPNTYSFKAKERYPAISSKPYESRLDYDLHKLKGIIQIGPPAKIDNSLYIKLFGNASLRK
jgi:hypothetical protein